MRNQPNQHDVERRNARELSVLLRLTREKDEAWGAFEDLPEDSPDQLAAHARFQTALDAMLDYEQLHPDLPR